MLRRIALAILLLCSTAAFGAPAASPLKVELKFAPEHALPSIPVEVTVTITNRSAKPAFYTDRAAFEVTHDGDAPFIAELNTSEPEVIDSLPAVGDDDHPEMYRLSAGETRRHIYALPLHLTMRGLWSDRRVSDPGSYSVRVAIQPADPAKPLNNNPRAAATPAERVPGWVWSQPALLQIDAPIGVDAEAWADLKKLGRSGSWSSRDWQTRGWDAAAMLREKYPTSTYAIYAAPFVQTKTQRESEEILKTALQATRDPAFAETLRLQIAYLHVVEYYECANKRCGESVAQLLATKARADLTSLIDTTNRESIRRSARKQLDQLNERAGEP
ncbi:MAG TPA: hypothetical protein VFN10_14710 [Thermoanaerobaculia bacterium]|nr:hypothetical protein [Thermoanaerobaculia bacterium]